jgi:hypothetical protein
MNEVKKNFFRRPSVAQIRNNTKHRGEVFSDFWENILSLKENESITLVGKMYKESSESEFLKRGPAVIVPVRDPKNPNLLPFEIRRKVFNELKDKKILHYSGFVFTPEYLPGYVVDMTPRRVRLNSILEAARIYAYAPYRKEPKPFIPSIQIIERLDTISENQIKKIVGVVKDGAEITEKLPSRTIGKRKYEIKYFHVPVYNDENKFHIAPMIKTNHRCTDKDKETKHSTAKEPDFVSEYRLCEHEIAGYFALADFYKNINKLIPGERHNIIPLRMNMIGIPTPLISKVYDNSLHRVLIKDTPDSDARVPIEADLECILWEGPVKLDYDACFFFQEKGMKLKDFPWTQYGQIKAQ